MTSWRTGNNVFEENVTSAENLYSHHMSVYKSKLLCCVREVSLLTCSFTLHKNTNCKYFRTKWL